MNNQTPTKLLMTMTIGCLLWLPLWANAAEKSSAGVISKTPLLMLEKREASSVSIVPLGKERLPLRAVVTYFDAKGSRLAVRKGRVIPGGPAFVATLEHDELPEIESVLVRTEVRLVPTRQVASGIQCPAAISMQNTDGPVIAWVGEPCACGPSQGSPVFAECVGSSAPVISQ